MGYFQNFNWKIMAQRVVLVVLTAFCAAFSKQYNLPDHNFQLALQAGLATLPVSIPAGLGLDQLVYHFFSQPEVAATVAALQNKNTNP